MEKRNCFAMPPMDLNKRKKQFEDRIAKARAKSSIDCSIPRSLIERDTKKNKTDRKKTAAREREAQISKHNLELAHRIFGIMDNPSQVAHYINDTRHLDVHPGTMNFPARLEEAQRIHRRNLEIAHRLDKCEPYYTKAMLGIKAKKSKKKKSKDKHTAGIGHYMGNGAILTQASHASASPSFKRAQQARGKENQQAPVNSARKDEVSAHEGVVNQEELSNIAANKQVLLEYTKIQDSRVIDVVVVKEANADKYSIHGTDIDSGRQYELHLSGQEVSNILDGDILVTSTENVEVWMTLLNKVTLKLRAGQEKQEQQEGEMAAQDLDSYFSPHAPGSAKPSDRPGARAGSRVNDKDGGRRAHQLGPKEEAPGAFDDDRDDASKAAAIKIQMSMRRLSVQKRADARKTEGENEGSTQGVSDGASEGQGQDEEMLTPREGSSSLQEPVTERTKAEVRKASIALVGGLGIPGLAGIVTKLPSMDESTSVAGDGSSSQGPSMGTNFGPTTEEVPESPDKDDGAGGEEARPAEPLKPTAPKSGKPAGAPRRKGP